MDGFQARPALNLGPLFFTFAIKEGGSEKFHVDCGNSKKSLTFVAALGDFTGGELCIPGFEEKFPLKPGQVIAFQARLPEHATATIKTGTRLVVTGFTDIVLARNANGDRDKVLPADAPEGRAWHEAKKQKRKDAAKAH